MAIAVNGGHVSRAIDFYEKSTERYITYQGQSILAYSPSMYLALGGTQPWSNEPTPVDPSIHDYKLRDIIALKKIDPTKIKFVIPDDSGDIVYKNTSWRSVDKYISVVVSEDGITRGSRTITVSGSDILSFSVGRKICVANIYTAKITEVLGSTLTVDTVAPVDIDGGALVTGGALVEEAKYVYLEFEFDYDNVPVATYRQLGLYTGVVPKSWASDKTVLKSAAYNTDGDHPGEDEYLSLGTLEVLDNRYPTIRDASLSETISFIIEF